MTLIARLAWVTRSTNRSTVAALAYAIITGLLVGVYAGLVLTSWPVSAWPSWPRSLSPATSVRQVKAEEMTE
jgi:hypothetical protein